MSMMNCAEAIQSALDAALDRSDSVTVIHVDADADSEPAWGSRRLNLPLTGDAGFDFALGCAQAGMLPVLDLRALSDAEDRLREALSRANADELRPMIVRLCSRNALSLPGMRSIAPQNPIEAAGAMRYALQAASLCAVIENPLAAYDVCDVPDEPDGPLFCGRWLTAGEQDDADEPTEEEASVYGEPLGQAETPAEFETAVEAELSDESELLPPQQTMAGDGPAVTDAVSDAPAPLYAEQSAQPVEATDDLPAAKPDQEPIEEPAKEAVEEVSAVPDSRPVFFRETASRARGYDPSELMRTADLLGISRDGLTRLCCEKAAETADVLIETDSEPGETAVIPPTEKAACLWVGSNRLSLCWRTDEMSAQDARVLLNQVSALLALPARLILERKN